MPVFYSGKSLNYLQNCKPHAHDAWEIILNLEGCGENKVGGETYPFSPGSIICIPPRTTHAKISEDRFLDIFIECTDLFVTRLPQVLTFQDDTKEIETLMDLIYLFFHKRDGYHTEIIASLFDAIQYILLSKSENAYRNGYIFRFVKEIIENIHNPEFDIAAAFDAIPYSRDYIRRLFRQETGMAPVPYLNSLRIQQARRLLQQRLVTRQTVAEIAMMCGYYDPKYFSRLFKRATGLTPLQYAKTAVSEAPPSQTFREKDA